MQNSFSIYIRIGTALIILASIGIVFYVKIILNDYEIIETSEGPSIEQ
jgi:hypothetical protein